MARGEPLIRQWNLLKALQASRFGVSADELAQRLECSVRQVKRDLSLLEVAGFPITYEDRDFGKRFWRLETQFIQKEQLMLTLTEMISLFLGKQLLSPLAGTALGDGLNSALEKIKAILPRAALNHFGDMDQSLLVRNIVQHNYQGHEKEIDIINRAAAESLVLNIRYQEGGSGKLITSQFHPYGMVLFGTNLYCVGFLACYSQVRVLKIVRLRGAELTEERFERPANFSLESMFKQTFGIIASGKPQRVRVKFTGWAATNIREQQWHPSQKIIADTGKCATAEFVLNNTLEFKRWILGFGRHATILAPKPLADEIRDELSAMVKNYE